jgi:hypothetical protein
VLGSTLAVAGAIDERLRAMLLEMAKDDGGE